MTFLTILIEVILTAIVAGITYRRRKDTNNVIAPVAMAAVGTFVGSVLVAWVINKVSGLYIESLWYSEVGYANVWSTQIWTKVFLFVGAAHGFLLLVWISIETAHHNAPYKPETSTDNWDSWTTIVRFASLIVLIIVALVVGGAGAGVWEAVLLYTNQVPFNVLDPVYGKDISFYVFSLSLMNQLLNMAFLTLGLTAVATFLNYWFLYYRVTGQFGNGTARDQFIGRALSHGKTLLGVLFLLIAFWSYLQRYWLVVDGTSARVGGAAATDVYIRMGGHLFLAIVAFLTALICFGSALMKRKPSGSTTTRRGTAQIWRPSFGVWAMSAVTIVTWLLATMFIPWIHHTFWVQPAELDYERPFIQNQINATRAAYGLDQMEDRGVLTYTTTLAPAEIQTSDALLQQSRIVDWRPFNLNNASQQSLKQYYGFGDSDVIRYGGRQVMQSLREMNASALQPTWINVHLAATHGYGYTMGVVNEITPQGQPVYLVRDIPLAGPKELTVAHPEIYFGEGSTDWVAVNTHQNEIGPDETADPYKGTAGIPLGSGLRRMAFAIYFNDYRLLISSELNSNSRILFRRTPVDRFKALAPFLRNDPDPYAVVNGDRMTFIIDGFTTADSFPYSVNTGSFNYLRNSVKATVDTYEGRVHLYLVDSKDPISVAWSRAFPGLFEELGKMPADLRLQMRYPEAMIDQQAAILNTYHLTSADAVYNNIDRWALSQEKYAEKPEAADMEARFVMMALPGESKAEFLLIRPFTVAGKQNMAAWLAGRVDGDNFNKLVLYRLPLAQGVP
ncbi:MAG: hypothetical protein RI947_740, partial [Candidatus Parcubacteria bacterium]